jgi:hypothetical protein
MSDDMRRLMEKAGADLAAADAARQAAVELAKKTAQAAYAEGMTEVELAKLFDVDRARTIRRWLGKTSS